MRNFLVLVALVFAGVLAWRLSDTISRDAVIMGVGFLFGALAGVPAALLVVASQRRHQAEPYQPMPHYPQQQQAQPPVIVLDAGHRQRPDIAATGGGTYQMMAPRGRFIEQE